MHFVQAKTILSPKNGMNIYRGCSHGCIYCDSRSLCYRMAHDFEDIEVKANAPELLEEALRHKRSKCMIGTGSMCDPYIPLEKELELTRKCISLVEKYHFGYHTITKSDLILRDLDLLQKINENTKAVVSMTLTTYDDALCRILEPHVCPTSRRVEVLSQLSEAGIPTIVWLGPILPFINDTRENIQGILSLCADANVYGILCFGMGLTLRDGNREYYYQKLDEYFPGLSEKYSREFGLSYSISSPHNRELMALFHDFCTRNNIEHNSKNLFLKMNELKKSNQTTLF